MFKGWVCAVAVMLAVSGSGRAAAEPVSLDVYGALPAVDLVALSPSGGEIAMAVTGARGRELVVRNPGGAETFKVALGKIKIGGLYWVGDDHLLMFASTTVKDYNLDRFEYSVKIAFNVKARMQATFIAPPTAGFAGTSRSGGHVYAYFYTVTSDNISESGVGFSPGSLMRADLDTGRLFVAAQGSALVDRDWIVSPEGALIAEQEYNEQTGHWMIYAGADHRNLIRDSIEPLRSQSLEGLGRTKDKVLVQAVKADGPKWFEVALADGAQTELFQGEQVEAPIYDRDSGLLIGTLAGDDTRPRLFDSLQQANVDLAMRAPEGVRCTFQDRSRDGGAILTRTEGEGDAGSWRLTKAATGETVVIGRAYPALAPEAVGSTRWVDYTAADGLKLRGVLTLPPGRPGKGLPVVVMPHGGPIAHDHPGFDWWAQAFASRGYAVWQPNFRGSDGDGQALIDAGNGQWGRKMQTDLSDGLDALARQGVVDPKRACIVGASYGGYAALAGVTLQQGLYRCAVSVAGVSDLNAMLHYQADRAGRVSDTVRFWKRLMGAGSLSDTTLAAISPARQAARADAPILLIHAENDTVVAINQSRDMEAALRRAGKPVEFVTLPRDDHHWSFEDTRQAMLKASVAFVIAHNPPD